MQQQILNLVLEQEELSWKAMLYNLVELEQMDPWDINISLLTQKYIELVQKMKEHDLKISGKVLLAAAILLKIKSTRFLDKDIADLDRLINQPEADEELLEGPDGESSQKMLEKQKYALIPRQPQPRSRKVSIHDLVQALQRAMETKKRILAQQKPIHFTLPGRNFDIMEVIQDIYHKIVYYANKEGSKVITFTKLLPPRAGKQEKVHTFIPVLHLETLQKIETEQKQAFAEIYITLLAKEKERKANLAS